MLMSGFFWNIRGFNKTRKQRIVHDWITTSAFYFGCILETRVKESKAHSIHNTMFQGWDLLTNYEHHRLGRIWVLWNEKVVMTPLFKSSQMIICSVSIPEIPLSFFCSFVYASNFIADRTSLWEDIRDHYHSPLLKKKAWIIMGDFNEIISATEHSVSNTNMVDGSRDFQNILTHCSLADLKALGPHFTWTNKQMINPICKKLDRVLINDTWLHSFPNSYSQFEMGGCSDHARGVIYTSPKCQETRTRKPFKFINILAQQKEFLPTVARHWEDTVSLFHSTSAIHRLTKKLKALKNQLRELNRETLGDIHKRTKDAYQILCDKQNKALLNPTPDAFEDEVVAHTRWNDAASLEECLLKQK